MWQALASAPSARFGHVAIGTQLTTSTDGGLLLIGAPTDPVLVVHGGVEASASASQPLASVMVYNVTANTWWEHSSFHAPALVGHGAVVYDKQMCVATPLLFCFRWCNQASTHRNHGCWSSQVGVRWHHDRWSAVLQAVCVQLWYVLDHSCCLHTHTHSHALLWWRFIR